MEYTLIYSELNDFSTNRVIDWFIYYGLNYKRYNGKYSESQNNFNFNKKINLKLPKKQVFKLKNSNTSENEIINSIWFRRPSKRLIDVEFTNEYLLEDLGLKKKIIRDVKNNDRIYKEFFADRISDLKLGSYDITGLNKPMVLSLASEIGLVIPNTLITNQKSDVVDFLYENNSSIINKALYEPFVYSLKNEDYWISNKTIEINSKKYIPNTFGVSLFQEKIIKKYEIRSFYINRKFYSACIFSQDNDKTQLDFRNYDFNKPNRIVPYKLPNSIEEKLTKLMGMLNLNTGSIDLIKSQNGEFIFLEVNPVGQYDFISKPCNFEIDFAIFKFLRKHG